MQPSLSKYFVVLGSIIEIEDCKNQVPLPVSGVLMGEVSGKLLTVGSTFAGCCKLYFERADWQCSEKGLLYKWKWKGGDDLNGHKK